MANSNRRKGASPIYERLDINPFLQLTESQFLRRFRLSKAAVIILHSYLHNSTLSLSDIPLQLQLLTTLRFYATGRLLRAAAVARLPRARAKTVIGRVSATIVNELQEHYLDFPDTQQQERFKAEFEEIRQLENVIGCINSVPIPLGGYLGMEVGVGNEMYGQRLLKLLVVCGPQGQIISLMVQPYAEDDWHMFQRSYLLEALQNGECNGCLIASINFPPQSYFLIPIAHPRTWMDELYNFMHYATLQVSNHAINLLISRFPCLIIAMDGIYPSNLNVVAACGILHNLCLKFSVPVPPGSYSLMSGPRVDASPQNRSHPRRNREE